jgi:hypothetical protein
MSLKEIDFYHGSVFVRLSQCNSAISIRKLNEQTQGIYVLNEELPILIKHTTKKLSPWRFSFIKTNQDDLQKVKNRYGSALVIFVCGHDGICGIEFD